MPKKYTITYREADAPITEPVTKFGGQPVWLGEPQWPLSRDYDIPMQFVCQIALPPDLFGDITPRMAYLFMTDWDGEGPFPETFDPDGGENAVILQPGDRWGGPSLPLREGPTLYRRTWREGKRQHTPVECTVELKPGEDPEAGAWDDVFGDPHHHDELKRRAYWDALTEDKVGGSPVPTPFGKADLKSWRHGWHFLLQLNTKDDGDPFFLNLAPDGIGYAFISPDGRIGKFMWSR